MQFDIHIDTGQQRYRMRVERCYAGDAVEKFKISGGGKYIVLQSNRPQLLATGAKKSIDWKLLEGTIGTGNCEAATYALFRTMMAIEDHMKEQEPTWQHYCRSREMAVEKK